MSNHERSTKWWPRIAFHTVNRQAQTFCVLISMKSWNGRAEKTNDLRDRCCYHARVLLVAATLKENKQCLFTNVEKERTGITTSECVECATEDRFPRRALKRTQNKRRARSSRTSLNVGTARETPVR